MLLKSYVNGCLQRRKDAKKHPSSEPTSTGSLKYLSQGCQTQSHRGSYQDFVCPGGPRVGVVQSTQLTGWARPRWARLALIISRTAPRDKSAIWPAGQLFNTPDLSCNHFCSFILIKEQFKKSIYHYFLLPYIDLHKVFNSVHEFTIHRAKSYKPEKYRVLHIIYL